MWEATGYRRIQPDPLKPASDIGSSLVTSTQFVDKGPLCDLIADPHARIERGKRILENHLHARSGLAARIARKEGLARNPHITRTGLQDARKHPPQGTLAASGFAHKAENLSSGDFKTDLGHGLDDRRLRQQARADRESAKYPLDGCEAARQRASLDLNRRPRCSLRRTRRRARRMTRARWIPLESTMDDR